MARRPKTIITGAIHTPTTSDALPCAADDIAAQATTTASMGGNVRVGLEDSLQIARGKLATANAQLVAKIRRIVEDLGREIATADEAREILGLKGGDKTAI